MHKLRCCCLTNGKIPAWNFRSIISCHLVDMHNGGQHDPVARQCVRFVSYYNCIKFSENDHHKSMQSTVCAHNTHKFQLSNVTQSSHLKRLIVYNFQTFTVFVFSLYTHGCFYCIFDLSFLHFFITRIFCTVMRHFVD